jgi:hypothetical protein
MRPPALHPTPNPRFLLLVCGLIAAASSVGPVSAHATAGGRLPHAILKGSERSAQLGPAPLAAPFDCSQAETVDVALAMDDTLTGDTTESPDRVAGYSCLPWNESGGERIYILLVPEDTRLTATLVDYEADLDLFLLASCDGQDCLAGANAVLGVDLPPGTYWLIVDGFNGAAGAYGLRLETRYPGVPPSICEPGGALDLVCDATADTASGTIWDQENLLSFDTSCSPYVEQAGEVWYRITLAPRQEITATLDSPFFDGALWLFDGCGQEAACLAFADQQLQDETETLTWLNDTGEDRVVYLGVDGVRPVAQGPGEDPGVYGQFELVYHCQTLVPAARQSLGGLKARYR